jgi:hypothetical protein
MILRSIVVGRAGPNEGAPASRRPPHPPDPAKHAILGDAELRSAPGERFRKPACPPILSSQRGDLQLEDLPMAREIRLRDKDRG